MECLTIGELIDVLRCELKDPDGDIWEDKLLFDKIKQAYSHLLQLRPDLFSTSKEVMLERGKCLHEVCDCTRLIKVVSIDGNDCAPPDEESTSDNLNFLNDLYGECPTDDDEVFNPDSYTLVDCGDCSAFRFSKPTPLDKDITVILCCTIDIDFCPDDGNFQDIELPKIIFGRLYEGFYHLMLSKVYAVDRKCEGLMELSKLHFKYWQDFRDWWFRTDFAFRQADWDLYRQKTTGQED